MWIYANLTEALVTRLPVASRDDAQLLNNSFHSRHTAIKVGSTNNSLDRSTQRLYPKEGPGTPDNMTVELITLGYLVE